MRVIFKSNGNRKSTKTPGTPIRVVSHPLHGTRLDAETHLDLVSYLQLRGSYSYLWTSLLKDEYRRSI